MNWQKALTVVPASVIQNLLSGGLSYGAYNNLASTFFNQGVGWAQATGVIRRVLPEFSGTAFAEIFNHVQQGIKQERYFETSDAFGDIPTDKYLEREFTQPVRYRYIGEFEYIDDTTGLSTFRNKSYFTNAKLTHAQAEDWLISTFDEPESDSEQFSFGKRLDNVKVQNIEHNETWEY